MKRWLEEHPYTTGLLVGVIASIYELAVISLYLPRRGPACLALLFLPPVVSLGISGLGMRRICTERQALAAGLRLVRGRRRQRANATWN